MMLMAEADQDRAHLDSWVQEGTEEDLLAVWMAIQREASSPLEEVILRMAQVAFTDSFLRVCGEKSDAEG